MQIPSSVPSVFASSVIARKMANAVTQRVQNLSGSNVFRQELLQELLQLRNSFSNYQHTQCSFYLVGQKLLVLASVRHGLEL